MQTNEQHAYDGNSKGNNKAKEEEQARQHFAKTVKRDLGGRFVLRLPIKGEVESIDTTINMARSRFLNIENKIQRDELLRVEYVNFMNEYIEMGHMEQIKNEIEVPKNVRYLPHHAVIKTASITTKVRVVFDASARGTNGKSLNNILLSGLTVQEDIFSILCRLRKHRYILVAYVEKMYRQIKINLEDCDLQRIL